MVETVQVFSPHTFSVSHSCRSLSPSFPLALPLPPSLLPASSHHLPPTHPSCLLFSLVSFFRALQEPKDGHPLQAEEKTEVCAAYAFTAAHSSTALPQQISHFLWYGHVSAFPKGCHQHSLATPALRAPPFISGRLHLHPALILDGVSFHGRLLLSPSSFLFLPTAFSFPAYPCPAATSQAAEAEEKVRALAVGGHRMVATTGHGSTCVLFESSKERRRIHRIFPFA